MCTHYSTEACTQILPRTPVLQVFKPVLGTQWEDPRRCVLLVWGVQHDAGASCGAAGTLDSNEENGVLFAQGQRPAAASHPHLTLLQPPTVLPPSLANGCAASTPWPLCASQLRRCTGLPRSSGEKQVLWARWLSAADQRIGVRL